eukprot:10795456-Lingulodinium_polyedra.AAC.1
MGLTSYKGQVGRWRDAIWTPMTKLLESLQLPGALVKGLAYNAVGQHAEVVEPQRHLRFASVHSA